VLKNKTIERTYLPSFFFSPKNIILIIGHDGLVANTAQYAIACLIIAIHPDPQRYDGVLLPFDTKDIIGGNRRSLEFKISYQNAQACRG